MAIATINPATGETVKTFEPLSDAEVDERIERAVATFATYRLTTFAQRAEWMRAAAQMLEDEADEIARMMTTEMGKTVASARAEVLKCAKASRFFAEHAEALLADEPADADAVGAGRAYARYQPLGPVLAVMPWNFPAVASRAVLGARADGGQRRAAQARVERAANGALSRRRVSPRRLSRGCVPNVAHSRSRSRAGAARRPGSSRPR